MLDSIHIVVLSTSIAVILVAIVSSLGLRSGQRITLAAIVGAWIGVAVTVAGAGMLDRPQGGPLALLSLFATPLIAAALLAAFSPAFRAAALGLPIRLLIGLNVIRVLGALMLLMAADGRLAGPFPYSAGWGDVITGALALPVVWAATRTPNATRLIAAWNAFGVLDLIVAVMLGMVSANGSPIQLIHAGVGSAAITQLPWSLIPTVLVPYFLFSHALIFAQLRVRARNAAQTGRAVLPPRVQPVVAS
jgi:hypothetical protein